MSIIDAHAHIASWPTVEQSKKNLLTGMDTWGIECSLISHADCTSFPTEHEAKVDPISGAEGLRQTIAFARENPGRIYIAAWFKPLIEPEPTEEFVQLIKDNLDVVKALKFHPFCERLPADDPRLEPYYALARELGFPVLVHTAVDENSAIYHLVNAAKAHPDIRFVAAHLELCSDHRFAIDAIAEVPNIYADTAWVDVDSCKLAIQKLGIDRIMFGTDAPIDGEPTLYNPIYLAYFRNDAMFGKRVLSKLMRDNAIYFYKLHA